MKIGSLFSGYGGLDMAVASVTGGTTAWVSDVDKGACKILTHRFRDVPNHGDITQISWSEVEPVDILTGGFPCQDLSHAGLRAGLKEGTRSGLWSHMARAIDELRPRLVVAENVRGLLSADAPGDVEPCAWCVGEAPTVNLRALGVVLADLADLGYDAQWVGLRAADVGACHGRFRVFLIAHPAGDSWRFGDGDGRPVADSDLVGHERGGSARGRRAGSADGGSGPVSLLPTPMADDARRDPAAVSAQERRAAGHQASLGGVLNDLLPTPKATDGTKGGPNQRGSSGDLMLPSAVHLLPTPAVNDMGAGKTVEDWDNWTDAMKAKHGNGNGHGPSLAIEAQRLLPTPTRRDHKDHTIRREPHRPDDDVDTLARALTQFGDYAPAIARWENVIGRPAPSPTEPTGKGGAHRLSPAFVEWMMGLPAGWVTDVPGLTRNEALKALGNGVIPLQAVAALRHMLATERAA